jgi:serine/threonine protein kinase
MSKVSSSGDHGRRTEAYGGDPASDADAGTSGPRDAAPSRPWSGPFREGEVVEGGYEITGILGAGGMGVVYEALDRRLDRAVAIKVPLLAEFAQSLRREAQAMAVVHHPNLMTIHAVGQHGGTDFIVMERIYGMTLEDRLAEAWQGGRPMPIEEVLDVLIAVTDAVTAIHRAGIAHRDIKSANILIGGGRVVLMDFGLVTPEIALHALQPLAGSADYMAPELITGRVKPGNGPLVDLYAIGVVGFELLAGRRPYASDRLQAVIGGHLGRPVPDVRELRGDTPEELAALIGELMAKAPEDRPESGEALLWRLYAIRGAPSAPEPASMSVLIVDDDPEVGAVLKRNLLWSMPRLAVEAVSDAEAALERVKHRVPDIVVVDLRMPRMNGVELCMNLLSLDERPILVAMSAEASGADLSVLRSLGIRDFVPKDARFVAHLCGVIGDVRRARQGPPRSRPARHRGR